MSFQLVFGQFQQELDDHNDRRERLIKASRDVTNISKKAIFLLHRLMGEDAEDDRARSKRAYERGVEKLREVQSICAAVRPDVQSESFWRHHHAVSPGIQEYVEALSFAHYLGHGTLITLGEAQAALSDDRGLAYFPLSKEDYLLGLSDLAGELMRLAISGFSRRGGRARAVRVCRFVRDCKSDLDRFAPFVRGLRKKQVVAGQSLEKIENAVYAIVVRSSEFDLPPEMLDTIARSASDRACKDKQGGRGAGDEEHEDN